MSKRKEIDPEFRIWLIEEYLTGRMRGREAARRTGVPFAAGVDLTEALCSGIWWQVLSGDSGKLSNKENQKIFAAWQAEQARRSAKEKQDVPAGERPAIHMQLFSSWVRPLGCTLFIFNQEDKSA